MYAIYWMNKNDKDWTENEVYITKGLAIKFLEKEGYKLKDGWYRRKEIGWEGETRALVDKVTLRNMRKNPVLNWESKLGLSTFIKNQEVVTYLANLGFTEGKLEPEYTDEETKAREIKNIGSDCLKLNGKEPFSDVEYTIYVNDKEAYVERKTDKYESSKHIGTNEPLSMDTIDVILNKIL